MMNDLNVIKFSSIIFPFIMALFICSCDFERESDNYINADVDWNLSDQDVTRLSFLAKRGDNAAGRQLSYFYESVGNYRRKDYWLKINSDRGDCKSSQLLAEYKSKAKVKYYISEAIMRKCHIVLR